MNGNNWSDGEDRKPVFPYIFKGELRLIDEGEVLSTMYSGTVSVSAIDKWHALTLLGKHFQMCHGELYCDHDGHRHVASIRNAIPRWPETLLDDM